MLRVIVLLKSEPSAQSEVLNALDWVFIKAISIFFVHWAFLLLWRVPHSLPLKNSPTAWAATSTLYFWDGTLQAMSRAGFLQTWCLELRFIRPESKGAFLQIPCVFSCLHWWEDWVWPHRHKAQIGGVLQWYLSSCKFLQSAYMSMELNWSDHQILGHQYNQAPSPSIAQFGQEASSRKSPGCFKLLLLRITETTCICDPLMKQIFFWTLPQMCGLTQTSFWALQAVLLTSGLVFCSDMHYQLLDLLLRRVPFQIIPIQINLPQFNSTRSVVTSTSDTSAPELNFNCPR